MADHAGDAPKCCQGHAGHLRARESAIGPPGVPAVAGAGRSVSLANIVIRRDYYIADAVQTRSQRYRRPFRGFAKLILEAADVLAWFIVPPIARRRRRNRLVGARQAARSLGARATQAYLPGPTYLEIQIGRETRPVVVVAPG